MGTGITVGCSGCGWNKEYYLGVGMMYSSLENVLDFIHMDSRKKKKIQVLLQNLKYFARDFEHRLYACPKCETLQERFYVRIGDFDTTIYETQFRCGSCRNVLIDSDLSDISAYRCRQCNRKKLRELPGFRWD